MFGPTLIKLAILMGVATPMVAAKGWARFCDDTACSDNCGEWVSTSNPGCLQESGRKSIQFKELWENLVFSPDDKCSCQTECVSTPGSGPKSGCQDITSFVTALSFRFIGDNCGGNNC
ncbi:hypothetical protein F4776DRAFT_591889 [Hypoxylon sp. NC0597]|nr:hypothetical protein F4776DRAFT_591889 [Hypoxylon sp. NC0597]